MIGFIEGKIIWADNNTVIVSANGIGYEITFRNNITISEYGTEFRLFITQKISEFGQAMFGFRTIEEKMLFENLESIKGVGAKVIFTILSSLEITTYAQLQNLKLEELVKLPGVGKSTGQKFLLGLSSKLKKEFELEKMIDNKVEIEKRFKGEIDLLVEWGLRKNDLVSFIKENQLLFEGKSSEQVIQLLLKNFNR